MTKTIKPTKPLMKDQRSSPKRTPFTTVESCLSLSSLICAFKSFIDVLISTDETERGLFSQFALSVEVFCDSAVHRSLVSFLPSSFGVLLSVDALVELLAVEKTIAAQMTMAAITNISAPNPFIDIRF